MQCIATSKRTRERCRRHAVTGWQVCQMHGAGGGAPAKTFRYAYSAAKNPILGKNLSAILEEGADDYDISPEIALMRARLATAIEEGVDIKVINEIHRDLLKGVQKNIELQIKRQGLIQRSDAEKYLKAVISVIVGYVPPANKSQCFEEITRVLSGGSPLLAENVLGDEYEIEGELLPALTSGALG